MSYITRNQLSGYSSVLKSYALSEAQQNLRLEKASSEVVIFLSHSHHDKDLIENARLLIASQGVKTYVDYKDPSMSSITTPETARLLKEKIKACKKFIMLATNNALESKWVPWELGFADSALLINNVAIFPVADNDGTWRGSEYVGIYQSIEKGDSGDWGVFPSNATQGKTLSYWLRN
jgi:hypothetical protein